MGYWEHCGLHYICLCSVVLVQMHVDEERVRVFFCLKKEKTAYEVVGHTVNATPVKGGQMCPIIPW